MRRKLFLLTAIAVAFLLPCCSDDDEEIVVPDIITVDDADVILGSSNTHSFSFRSVRSWTITFQDPAQEQWCRVSPAAGDGGKSDVTVTADPNNTFANREAVLVIRSGEAEKTIKIIQNTIFESNNLNIPDAVFRAYCFENFDKNGDGIISFDEVEPVKELLLVGNGESGEVIKSLEGLRFFISLEVLNCSDNDLTTLDMSGNLNLKNFKCRGNNSLKSLDLSRNTKLEYLDCSDNAELSELWLAEGQEIEAMIVDEHTKVKYK